MKKKDIDLEKSVRICPFCGHHGQELKMEYHHLVVKDESLEVLDEHHELWWMECRCCGARGPVEFEPRFAVYSWNVFHRKPAHSDDPEWMDFIYDADSIRRKENANGNTKKEKQQEDK